jgi:hypothetical protein
MDTDRTSEYHTARIMPSLNPVLPRPAAGSTPPGPPVYSAAQVVDLLGGSVTERTLLRWVRLGRFIRPLGVGCGRTILFSKAAVDDLLAGRSPGG